MVDKVFSSDEIEAMLLAIDPDFEVEPHSQLLGQFASLLVTPVNKQFQQIFVDLYDKHLSKANMDLS